ncbi:MAG TPA: DUF1800 family protein, partial [Tepidisphaeraceae bacterium]|nr:DUF1800 family protein [Tepidisphaeraceae bacterium]
MPRRPCALRLWGIVLFILGLGASAAQATPPVLLSAVSRMTHSTAGTFDVQLPLSGGTGVECRTVASGLTIVLTFDQAVVSGSAAVVPAAASVNGAPTFAGNTMTVKLNVTADAQTITLTLSNVANGASELLPSQAVTFRTLLGDVNANGLLSGSDVNIAKAAVAANVGVTSGNFRSDVNANGSLSGTDVNMIKAAVSAGTTVGGGATANTPPTISTIANQQAVTGQPMSPVGFTVGDAESDPSTIYVSATSSDLTTIPNANITFTGTGTSRTINITPASGVVANTQVVITMTASDGLALSSPSTFTVTVTPPPGVYVATLQPIAGTNSLGSGTATLTLSGDQTYAILKYSLSNLAGTDTDDTVDAPGDQILYDVPVGRSHGDLQPDGSLKWIFNVNQAASIVQTITGNNAYMVINTSANPAGELKGTFQKVVGSQTFTPPPPPPSITINPPTAADASRFLQQSQFGGTGTEIASLSNSGAANASTAINDWLNAQFAQPGPIYPDYSNAAVAPTTQPVTPPGPQSASQPYTSSSMYYNMYVRCCSPQSPNPYGDNLDDTLIHETWWKNTVTAPDQLRQRVATAYSEIFVVSEINDNLDAQIPGMCTYYDMLADDAFVSFKQLLSDITLHPIMGEYLNMRGNKKATAPAVPNENYGREVLQLFSIGLYMLQPDGTLMLDANGQPIPTYDQPTITSFAQVFTGWDVNNTGVTVPELISDGAGGATTANFTSRYQKPMVLTQSNHSTTVKNLLVYPGAATWSFGGASGPSQIPANSGQTASVELNFAIDNIVNHPNVGPFICRQLIQRLVGSNPSPAYVYRVAQVFNNDGSGNRGNMKAVITAILTDYEARSPAVLSDPGYGHMREPMIRVASL